MWHTKWGRKSHDNTQVTTVYIATHFVNNNNKKNNEETRLIVQMKYIWIYKKSDFQMLI